MMVAIFQDYWNGVYREVPWMTIAAVVAACQNLVQSGFEAYKGWENSH